MGHYLSEMEDDPPEVIEAARKREQDRHDRVLAFVAADIEKRGIAEVVTDMVLSLENYASRARIRY